MPSQHQNNEAREMSTSSATNMQAKRACAATRCLAELRNLQSPWHHSSTSTNHNALPAISPNRLALSFIDGPINSSTSSEKHPTVLYLAYGSNLAARTFKGVRGIRPISATNVVVPTLELTFALPGIPYNEPAFANTRYKTPAPQSSSEHPPYTNPAWTKGLVGTVYEVTLSDYEHILATEGGGLAYGDHQVDCYPLPRHSKTVPCSPPQDGMFKAHTLISTGHALERPDPDYGQPSLRYLTLLRDGAEENGLPDEYRRYLDDLCEYRATTLRQRMGKWINLAVWVPIVMTLMKISAALADEKGRAPEWVKRLLVVVFTSVWVVYDGLFLPVFGEGERTVEGDGGLMECEREKTAADEAMDRFV